MCRYMCIYAYIYIHRYKDIDIDRRSRATRHESHRASRVAPRAARRRARGGGFSRF